ncbi:NUDIX hydrolase [Yoonia litorea]|uniref:8-oxo-dGTP pyrophosphatase MutT, NUDIX family n=1 Tax=Yoonia litorea TaxID=1123755 RepID=A0A1I6MJI2_9RHOB|nr:NUDIX hydrolase [Yoonia litorea]SFS15833.1 8-oxo-dGTP pyrophosphatase MutT, NUDIX family [Yoonia litorea]
MSSVDTSYWTGPKGLDLDPAAISQVGALCLRDGAAGPEVLFVKSSRGRWIIPKGWPEDHLTDRETARAEAWEEAGVRKGKISKTPVGGYMTEKRYDDGRRIPCHVSVYRIDVRKTARTYPEAGMRRRKWLPLSKAIKKTKDRGLRAFLKAYLDQAEPLKSAA